MTQPPTYGSHNPHPLLTLRTELVWEGKVDEYGVGEASPSENRREVDIARSAMLFACVVQPLWSDNKLVMASLMRSFKSKVDLIYIDPSFKKGD